ncbi:hypothetical protein [Flavipsychrobacter stenotrophus]|uniref:hypothetical protein n=1 Tax=Flavipsychrobacter stenotrophus TaxID=2077091 RepID=UPI00196A39C4|nr:hypothetical protein [Flavipsychrobacter stenotrophus]
MVQVIGYNIRKNKSGEEFIALDLMGSLEIVQSQNTGNMYATVRKCSIPSTFDAEIAKMMIGSKIEGEIVRVPCDPYDYTVKRTGEAISLAYTYSYQPAGSKELIGHGAFEIEEPKAQEKPADGVKAASQRKRNEIAKTK